MFSFLKQSAEAAPVPSWGERLKAGLARTRAQIGGLFGGGKIDAALYEELESALLCADTGVAATQFLLENLRQQVRKKGLT
jgi:Signal recognition particle GTPase